MSDPVLLYDGVCGFCNDSVQFILRHESRRDLRFAALQGHHAAGVIARHAELLEVDSLIWVEGRDGAEIVKVRSAAALAVAAYLGGAWRALLALWLVPRPLRDWGYDLFARHRYRFFGRHASCPVPPPELRARFLG